MKVLLTKLETLVDEITGLIREERARRNLDALRTTAPVPTVTPPYSPFVPAPAPTPQPGIWWLQGPLCQTDTDRGFVANNVCCAPPPFQGASVWVGTTGPLGDH